MASNTFLAFFLGTVLVYASSKVLHRRGGTEEEVETLFPKLEKMKSHVISARPSLILTLIVLTCSYIAMMTLPLMRVEYEGVAGELLTILHAPDAQRVRHYYVPTIGAKVIAATPTVETYGVVMAIAFYLLVVVAPFLFIVSAFTLLFYVNKKASSVLNFIRAIFPWCGVDILIAGCVATWLEINMVLTWVIENSFPGLCDEIDELSRPGQTCIKLNVHLDIGFYFVLLATASFYLAYSLIRIYWC